MEKMEKKLRKAKQMKKAKRIKQSKGVEPVEKFWLNQHEETEYIEDTEQVSSSGYPIR